MTADARFQVDDVYAVGNCIEDAAIAAGGFVLDNAIGTDVHDVHLRGMGDGTRLRLSEIRTSGTITVRVPVAETSRFLRSLAELMVFMDERRFQAQDMQFELLRRQLAWARHEQLQADAARAGSQPARVGDKLDAAGMRAHALQLRDEAQVSQRELEDAVAFNTVQLHLYQDMQVRRQVEPDTDALMAQAGPGIGRRLVNAVQAGWREMLISGNRVVVIGYSYGRSGTEIGLAATNTTPPTTTPVA